MNLGSHSEVPFLFQAEHFRPKSCLSYSSKDVKRILPNTCIKMKFMIKFHPLYFRIVNYANYKYSGFCNSNFKGSYIKLFDDPHTAKNKVENIVNIFLA